MRSMKRSPWRSMTFSTRLMSIRSLPMPTIMPPPPPRPRQSKRTRSCAFGFPQPAEPACLQALAAGVLIGGNRGTDDEIGDRPGNEAERDRAQEERFDDRQDGMERFMRKTVRQLRWRHVV